MTSRNSFQEKIFTENLHLGTELNQQPMDGKSSALPVVQHGQACTNANNMIKFNTLQREK